MRDFRRDEPVRKDEEEYMEKIVLHVYYSGAEEALRTFVREMESGLQRDVKAEDGCEQYDYFLPVDGEPCVLLLERWRDAEALRRHMAQPRMEEIRAQKERLGLTTRVERYE